MGQAKRDDEQDALPIVPGLESRFGVPACNKFRGGLQWNWRVKREVIDK